MTKYRIIWLALGSVAIIAGVMAGVGAQTVTQRPQPTAPAPSRPSTVPPSATQQQAKGEIVARLGDVEIFADDIRADIAGLAPAIRWRSRAIPRRSAAR